MFAYKPSSYVESAVEFDYGVHLVNMTKIEPINETGFNGESIIGYEVTFSMKNGDDTCIYKFRHNLKSVDKSKPKSVELAGAIIVDILRVTQGLKHDDSHIGKVLSIFDGAEALSELDFVNKRLIPFFEAAPNKQCKIVIAKSTFTNADGKTTVSKKLPTLNRDKRAFIDYADSNRLKYSDLYNEESTKKSGGAVSGSQMPPKPDTSFPGEDALDF